MNHHLIPIKTYRLTIDTSLSKAVATHLLSRSPFIRNISFRITSETPAGLRAMYFPNTDELTQDLRDDLSALIERMLGTADEIAPAKVLFD